MAGRRAGADGGMRVITAMKLPLLASGQGQPAAVQVRREKPQGKFNFDMQMMGGSIFLSVLQVRRLCG